MRFSSVIVSFIFYAFFSSAVEKNLYGISLLKKQGDKYRKEALCTRFVSESFRKTCDGRGFESLSEWKSACSAMWKLDYISFEEKEEEGVLYHGVWTAGGARYEVYFRKKI